MNHYHWLDKNINIFFNSVLGNTVDYTGMISSHGDKCYSYQKRWEEAGIPFPHGVAIYLLGRTPPFDKETGMDKCLYVGADKWVIENYSRFKKHLPPT